MDLESAGADFDCVAQSSNSATSDAGSSANVIPNAEPINTLTRPSEEAAISAGLPDRSHSRSPALPPAHCSTPNSPVISPAPSRPNTPAFSPVPSRANTPPISPAASRPAPPVSPTPHSLTSQHGGEEVPMDSELALVETGSGRKEHDVLGTKRGNEHLEDENVAPCKRTRSSKRNAASVSAMEDIDDAPSKRTRASKMNATSVDVAVPPNKRTRHKSPAPSTAPSTKRGRNNAVVPAVGKSSPSLAPRQAEINSPPWFSKTLAMLESESRMGEAWTTMVRAWALFEAASGYEEVKKLGAVGRPSAVGDWIGRARSSTWRPVIRDLPQYEASFWIWWSAIQPDWRLDEGDLVRERVVGDWEPLRRPGINGMVSVLVALFYWGLEILEDSSGRNRWLSAVEECQTAFRHL